MTCQLTCCISIHSMVLQSIKSNMGHVWMDCPHREKLGWMEVVPIIKSTLQHLQSLTVS
jgi:hypothetical protein